ncbi:MAG TPA: hypothetical protein VGT40_12940 [Methylomirabilota bacterium]|nr:hypothetical protein [Methylomirabilota bacterium]
MNRLPALRSFAGKSAALPVAPGLQPVPRFAAICTAPPRNYRGALMWPDNRSKFNVPLGVEAQGFCVLK